MKFMSLFAAVVAASTLSTLAAEDKPAANPVTALTTGASGSLPVSAVPAAPTVFDGMVLTNNGARFSFRKHVQFKDDAAETEFRTVVNVRGRAQQDLSDLQRLQQDKQSQSAQLMDILRREFDIQSGANYDFEEDSGTIVELVVATNAPVIATNATPNVTRKPVKKLTKPEEKTRFVQLVRTRQLIDQQLVALATMRAEKSELLQAAQGTLTQRFSITSDRDYHLDAPTRTLFEIVPVPEAGAAMPAAAAPAATPAPADKPAPAAKPKTEPASVVTPPVTAP